MEAVNEFFGTKHVSWRNMFPEIAHEAAAARDDDDEADYISEEVRFT